MWMNQGSGQEVSIRERERTTAFPDVSIDGRQNLNQGDRGSKAWFDEETAMLFQRSNQRRET